ncbi:MAG: C40 family peptidase [Gammaproteobacteria bacterium]|nr:C40 family peptidase [Gammaproteobacteria bacterium]
MAQASAPVSAQRANLIRVTARQIGTPYQYGGNGRRGFDCSGLVQYVHRAVGIDVPRTADEQWRHSRTPRRRHLVPGDLVFFAIDGSKTSHVGVYEGGGRFIHAPSSGKRVSRASLDNPYWRERMVGARTFL